MPNPSMRQAEWIHKQLAGDFKESADDVFDALLETITTPRDFVEEVKYWAVEYAAELRRHNAKD